MLVDVSAMMSSELRRHCNHYFFFYLNLLHDMSHQLPVQRSTECTWTDTLHSDLIWFYDGTYLNTQLQTKRHPSINCHSRRGQPFPPSICLIWTFALIPLSDKQWDRYLSFLEERVLLSDRENASNAYVNLLLTLGWHVIQTGAQTEEGEQRWRILGYCMAGAFFDCEEIVDVAKKSKKKKVKKKNRKGGQGQQRGE